MSLHLADEPHAKGNEDDVEEQPGVCDEAVDGEHDEDDGIVAGEVGEVVVDPALDITEVVGLGKSLDIKELGNWLKIGEAGCDRLAAHAGEAVSKVEAGRDGVEGDADSGHFGGYVMLWVSEGRTAGGLLSKGEY